MTAAKSGVGGQVILNDKGKKGREGMVRSVAGTGQLRKTPYHKVYIKWPNFVLSDEKQRK